MKISNLKQKTVIPTSIYFAHIDTLLNHYKNVLLMSEYDFQNKMTNLLSRNMELLRVKHY